MVHGGRTCSRQGTGSGWRDATVPACLYANGENGISAADIEAAVAGAVEVEEYPDYHKGPSVLVLQEDASGQPLHVLWGVRKGSTTPAIVVTAYRPDPLDARLPEAPMKARKATQLVLAGRYAAEVEIELLEEDREWAPYLLIADAKKLDEVRLALQRGDIEAASRLGLVYELKPVAAR